MKIIAMCWTCGKEHDISNLDPLEYGVKCECDGYIVSPSGKVCERIVNTDINNKEENQHGEVTNIHTENKI